MSATEELRARAAEVLRSAADQRRAAERALQQRTDDLARVALAAVEGLETLTDALDGVRDEMPQGVRDLLRLSARAAWERLGAAGIALDGAVGEKVDLARHRVVKTVPPEAGAPGTVASVVTPGLTLGGTRLREALVWVVGERKGHGANRD